MTLTPSEILVEAHGRAASIVLEIGPADDAPGRHQGVVSVDGTAIWSCGEVHLLADTAWSCAKAFVRDILGPAVADAAAAAGRSKRFAAHIVIPQRFCAGCGHPLPARSIDPDRCNRCR